jgi:5'-nucleotidase
MKNSLWCLVVLALILTNLAPAQALTGPVDITILHTSDIHAHLMPFDCASGTAMGGYARIKSYKEKLEAQGRTVVLLSSGDVFQGTLFFRFFRGKPDVEFMNQSGYAAMAVGNHEFDAGQQGMIDAFQEAKFPVLSANLQFTAYRGLQQLIKPSTILPITVGSTTLKLGLIGLTDEQLMQDVPKAFLEGIIVETADTSLKRELPTLKAKGADVVVALAHLGWSRELELSTQFPELAGVLGGHSHLFIDPPVVKPTANGHQFVSQPGEFGRAVTRLDLRFSPTPQGVKTEVLAAGLMPMNAALPEDGEIKGIVDALWKQVSDKVSVPLGEALNKLDGDKPWVRERETTMGNLVADSMVRAIPADLAVINGGGVRSSIQTGVVTIGDCLNVLPFDNYLVKLTMTGDLLQKLFEQVRAAIAVTPGFGGFLQVSRGLVVRYGLAKAHVSLHGKPLDPAKSYTIVTNDFLAGSGNGLTAFGAAAASETSGILGADALMTFVRELKTIQYQNEGRIIRDSPAPMYYIPRYRLNIPRPRDEGPTPKPAKK